MGSPTEERVATKRKTSKPPGIRFTESITKSRIRFVTYQILALVLTFLAYASFHITRKTTSIVKGVLDPKSPKLSFFRTQSTATAETGWAPFNGPTGQQMLGDLDVAFLSVYAMGMYFAGHLGDRLDLRIFLTIGMIGTGIFTALFGLGYWLNIHNFYYYLIIQMLAGIFQSSGWPSVVAILGNWLGKSKRGLIMGVWNSHTSLGNISGSLMASALLRYGWGWSLLVPGIVIVVVGVLVFLFLPLTPEAMGVEAEEEEEEEMKKKLMLEENNLKEVEAEKAVGFVQAWKIPGVASFAMCLFFSKLVAYTFLYWLPFYISHTAIAGAYLSDSGAGTLSTIFDVGGVLGGILAGHISDRIGGRAITAASFMYCAIPALYLYRIYGGISLSWNIALMFVTGMFVNGPYALITTAVSADLGTHASLNGNSKALATVTAIIDGTGSVGAAIGPLITGYISSGNAGWDNVFTMLMGAAFVAGVLLTKLVIAEVKEKIVSKSRPNWNIT